MLQGSDMCDDSLLVHSTIVDTNYCLHKSDEIDLMVAYN
jgi:hypothetical protein